LTFTVANDAAANDYPITLDLSEGEFGRVDEFGEVVAVPATGVNTTLTVAEPEPEIREYPAAPEGYEMDHIVARFDEYTGSSNDATLNYGTAAEGNAYNVNSWGIVNRTYSEQNAANGNFSGDALRFWYKGNGATIRLKRSWNNVFLGNIPANTEGGWVTLYYKDMTPDAGQAYDNTLSVAENAARINQFYLMPLDGGQHFVDEIHTLKALAPETSVSIQWADDYTAATARVISLADGSVLNTVEAEVTSASVAGTTTYTATVEIDGTTYTATRTMQDTYSVAVVGGSITLGEKPSYQYKDLVRLTADEAPEGKYFSGWYIGTTKVSDKKSYELAVFRDVVLTAQYEANAEAEEEPFLLLTLSDRVANGNYTRVSVEEQWSLPEGCTMVEVGTYRGFDLTDQASLAVAKNKKASTLTGREGTFIYGINMGANSAAKTLCVVGYMTYTDGEGEHTIFTDIQTSSAN